MYPAAHTAGGKAESLVQHHLRHFGSYLRRAYRGCALPVPKCLHVLTPLWCHLQPLQCAEDAAAGTGEPGVGCCRNTSVSLTASATGMAAGGCRQTWAVVSVLALLAACSAVGGAHAQVIGADVTNSTLVFTSEGFAQALQTSNIHTILISCESAAYHLRSPIILVSRESAAAFAPASAACSCMQGMHASE